jgi:hypothetical protein
MESIVLALGRKLLPSSLYERLASSYGALRREIGALEKDIGA